MQNQLINIVSLPRAPPVTFVQFVFVILFPILIPSHIITVSLNQFVFVIQINSISNRIIITLLIAEFPARRRRPPRLFWKETKKNIKQTKTHLNC